METRQNAEQNGPGMQYLKDGQPLRSSSSPLFWWEKRDVTIL